MTTYTAGPKEVVGEPGEVVWANCLNSLENRNARGKLRPMLIIRRVGGQFNTVGLTTNPRFRSGEARVVVPDPAGLGLRGAGYIWGRRVTSVSVLDVVNHAGWAHEPLLRAVLESVDLSFGDRAALERYCEVLQKPHARLATA